MANTAWKCADVCRLCPAQVVTDPSLEEDVELLLDLHQPPPFQQMPEPLSTTPYNCSTKPWQFLCGHERQFYTAEVTRVPRQS